MESTFPLFSTAILLFFILDPFGNVPLLLSVLKNVDKQRHTKIIIREMLIGFFILVIFLFFGEQFLSLFHLETQAITIAGGIIFFVIYPCHFKMQSQQGKLCRDARHKVEV